MGIEKIGIIQKEIIQKAQKAGCKISIGTGTLDSLKWSQIPLRAEIIDITNSCLRKILKRYEKGTIQYDIISKDRLSTLIKIMQISLTSNRFGGFRLFKKILLSRNDLSLKTKLPYLLGPSVAKNYSVKRLKKAKQKNLKLQYWD